MELGWNRPTTKKTLIGVRETDPAGVPTLGRATTKVPCSPVKETCQVCQTQEPRNDSGVLLFLPKINLRLFILRFLLPDTFSTHAKFGIMHECLDETRTEFVVTLRMASCLGDMMKSFVFHVPDTLFVKSTIITDIRQKGDEVTLVGEPFDEEVGEEWHGDFVTSDVASLSTFDRMVEISHAIRKARDEGWGPKEILFRISGKNSDILGIQFRTKKKAWT
jgi:hypothetical protein